MCIASSPLAHNLREYLVSYDARRDEYSPLWCPFDFLPICNAEAFCLATV